MMPFQNHERPAYNGLALVVVRLIKGKDGKIAVTATADNLKPATVVVRTVSNGAASY